VGVRALFDHLLWTQQPAFGLFQHALQSAQPF